MDDVDVLSGVPGLSAGVEAEKPRISTFLVGVITEVWPSFFADRLSSTAALEELLLRLVSDDFEESRLASAECETFFGMFLPLEQSTFE